MVKEDRKKGKKREKGRGSMEVWIKPMKRKREEGKAKAGG